MLKRAKAQIVMIHVARAEMCQLMCALTKSGRYAILVVLEVMVIEQTIRMVHVLLGRRRCARFHGM